jgi:four helix bundle protein
MENSSYKGLLVWQKAMDVTALIYKLVKKLPKEELYSLGDQMRRAAVSIPSNIAEGQDRHSKKEFIQFLHMSRGSKAELETQLLICVRVGYLNENDILEVENLLAEIGKMITSLINRLKKEVGNAQISVAGTKN